ncbi:class I SAM-dependent methyltransferase [Evansella sp. AB-rgal1]|uniref:class I SAM-dependent methyltransferase n=1 Tax=Evansella sp. AB-rgal1 TaxID=3242696 RepID=UPI00359D9A00
MGDHYYNEKPTVESDRKKITETIAGETLHFTVDSGVFSKKGIDYGSKLLVESFQFHGLEGSLCDVGCGWGPIGLTLAKKYPSKKVSMIDINERAVELTKLNAQRNNINNVSVFQNDLLKGQKEESFAVILTNPPIRAGKEVIFHLYEQAFRCLKPDGELWIVIQKKQGAPSTINKLETIGLDTEIVKKSKGYFILKGKKC